MWPRGGIGIHDRLKPCWRNPGGSNPSEATKHNKGSTMTWLQHLFSLNEMVRFWSTERPEVATKSEIRRWFERNSVIVDGSPVKASDEVQFPIQSLVLHPKGVRKITLI